MSTTVIDIPNITDSLLDAVLKQLPTSRKTAIAIKNYSSQTLENPRTFIKSGTSRKGFPPNPVPTGKGVVWGACKTSYSTNGTAGVIVYHIKDYNLSLAFMWSIPFAYLFYSNWWNLKVYEGLIEPDEDFFWMMYYDNPHKGDGNGKLSGGWSYKGSMGDGGQSIIVIDFQDGKN